MKVVIRPILDPNREIDVTHALIAAIAEELWRQFRGNERLNWLEAELHLSAIVSAEGERAARSTRADIGMMASGVAPERSGEFASATPARVRRRAPRPDGSSSRECKSRQHRGEALRSLG